MHRPQEEKKRRAPVFTEALSRVGSVQVRSRLGAEERTRTSTRLPGLDPESSVSTNFTTWANSMVRGEYMSFSGVSTTTRQVATLFSSSVACGGLSTGDDGHRRAGAQAVGAGFHHAAGVVGRTHAPRRLDAHFRADETTHERDVFGGGASR